MPTAASAGPTSRISTSPIRASSASPSSSTSSSRTNGTGFINEDRVRSQIDILNEDFLAISGTLGGGGDDAQIEFFLATEDPQGNPTNGITYSTNNTWFNDGGSYWNTLAWDTNRYLNIYTNSASGALGYVPDLPQGGIVGSNSDRVVVLYSTFGRNAPLSPFNLGRTGTHEVGHYLGLYHTFNGGCQSTSNCSANGDRICDTNPESSPTFGCPGARTSCGLPAPLDNYMDYSDDFCMRRFTPNQINRMRCTIEHYRSNLAITGPSACNAADIAEPFGVLDLADVNAFVSRIHVPEPPAPTSPHPAASSISPTCRRLSAASTPAARNTPGLSQQPIPPQRAPGRKPGVSLCTHSLTNRPQNNNAHHPAGVTSSNRINLE